MTFPFPPSGNEGYISKQRRSLSASHYNVMSIDKWGPYEKRHNH